MWSFPGTYANRGSGTQQASSDVGTADGIRTHDLQSRSYQAAFVKSLIQCGFAGFTLILTTIAPIPGKPHERWFFRESRFYEK